MLPATNMDPRDILTTDRTHLPDWIRGVPEFTQETKNIFFQSRVVFYPGAGEDGHAIKLFNSSRSAFCFVYADQSGCAYGSAPTGYRVVRDQAISKNDFKRLLSPGERRVRFNGPQPWRARWLVFQRKAEYGDDHGHEYIALLYIGGEAFTVYSELWVRSGIAPYAILIVDHGFGGNFTGYRFGGDQSPMYGWASEQNNWPHWLLVSELTEPWPGYQCVSNESVGGMHNDRRFLYRR